MSLILAVKPVLVPEAQYVCLSFYPATLVPTSMLDRTVLVSPCTFKSVTANIPHGACQLLSLYNTSSDLRFIVYLRSLPLPLVSWVSSASLVTVSVYIHMYRLQVVS